MKKTAVLGKVSESSYYLKVAEDAMNDHILLTGKSGGGKTVALWKIENGLSDQGCCVLVLNFNGTHNQIGGNQNVTAIKVKNDGIPLSFLTPISMPDGTREDIDDIVEAALDVFCAVDKLGVRQQGLLRKALYFAAENMTDYTDDFQAVYDGLICCGDRKAEAITDHFWNLFTKAKFRLSPNQKLFEPGKVTLLDLSGFNGSSQRLMAEMVLSTLWRYFQATGQHTSMPLYVVCDEFQALNLKEDAVLCQVLREGRKYNLSLLIATQTTGTFSKGSQAILQQAGTHLYFHPAESEMNQIVKLINSENPKLLKRILSELKIGECLAVGKFVLGDIEIERPMKISFR